MVKTGFFFLPLMRLRKWTVNCMCLTTPPHPASGYLTLWTQSVFMDVFLHPSNILILTGSDHKSQDHILTKSKLKSLLPCSCLVDPQNVWTHPVLIPLGRIALEV